MQVLPGIALIQRIIRSAHDLKVRGFKPATEMNFTTLTDSTFELEMLSGGF